MKRNFAWIFVLPVLVGFIFAMIPSKPTSKQSQNLDLTTHYGTPVPPPDCSNIVYIAQKDSTPVSTDDIIMIDHDYRVWMVTTGRLLDKSPVLTTGAREWPADVWSCWPNGVYLLVWNKSTYFAPEDAWNVRLSNDRTTFIFSNGEHVTGIDSSTSYSQITDEKLLKAYNNVLDAYYQGLLCPTSIYSLSPAVLCPN